MNYRDCEDFIQNRMRMSHVYQPVMLMTLLRSDGKASTTRIAKAILEHDESQIEYYEKMPSVASKSGSTANYRADISRGHLSSRC